MNPKSAIAIRLFSEKEREALKEAVDNDEVIIKSIIEILEDRYQQTLPKKEYLDKPNYEFRRTFLDGAASELLWLIKLLEDNH